MKSRTLSLSLRVALYRRAVACAWLSACYQQNRHLQ
ncbi:DNA replication protein, partial [Escherichia coli]|nr:DNA replication protein [Escherichia coli]